MGLFDKLKNVFFEEEYVEVEEPEKEEPREKVAVAKKIETPEFNEREREREKEEVHETREEKHEEKESLEFTKENDFKFPMNFDDKDFEVEKTMEIFEHPIKEEPVIDYNDDDEEDTYQLPVIEEKTEYHYEESSYSEPYKTREEKNEVYHGLYEAHKEKEEKPGFTPSPIISTIYGILNKNYKKEEIVTKREVRLSQFSHKKADLDQVREKAYGDLAGEISASIDEEEVKEEPKQEVKKEELFYDLSDDSPTVKTVTVGDAEEYFKDLGLEYNVDYKVEKDDVKPIIEKPVKEEKEDKKEEEKNIEKSNEDDKNLFDLIDAMYDEKE